MHARSSACLLALVAALTGCGSSGGEATSSPGSTAAPAPAAPARSAAPVVVAALGDSITAGSPLFDPDPAVRAQIGAQLDPRSSYEFWATRRLGAGVRFRNCGVFGERTDEIAARYGSCVRDDARVLVVQGGINDIAQGRPVADAAADLAAMVARGRRDGLRVAIVEVLPWNNGYPRAAPLIDELNRRIRALARRADVPVLRWYRALEDPAAPGRMRPDLTIDGDHPSVAGYRRLAALVRLPLSVR